MLATITRRPDPFTAFDSFFGRDPFEAFAPLIEAARASTSHSAAVEWFSDDEAYYARLDLPGVPKTSLSLEFESGHVTLSIAQAPTKDSTQGSYKKRIQVPDGIEADQAEATLIDGVLTLTLPKTAEKKPVSIEIA